MVIDKMPKKFVVIDSAKEILQTRNSGTEWKIEKPVPSKPPPAYFRRVEPEPEERSLWYTVEPAFMVFLNKFALL